MSWKFKIPFLRKKKINEKQLFIIYTMGKVGSKSIGEVFRVHYPKFPVAHVHFLSDKSIKEDLPKSKPGFQINLIKADRTFNLIKQNPEHRIKIISVVRETISREISNIFENWKSIFNTESFQELSYEKLAEYVESHKHHFALNWYDTEFKAYLDFDVYNYEFDKQKGYSVYKCERFDILLIRMDKINSCLKDAMKELADLEIELVKPKNTADEKKGKEKYEQLMSNFKASKEKLQYVYQSKFMKHFYTDEELNEFIGKWSRGRYDLKSLNE